MNGQGWMAGPTRVINGSLNRFLRSGLQYARIRIELVELELQAERERMASLLARFLALALAGLMTLQLLSGLIIAVFWDTPWRVHAFGVLSLAALAAVGIAWYALRKLRAEPNRPIANALRDLDKLIQPSATNDAQ